MPVVAWIEWVPVVAASTRGVFSASERRSSRQSCVATGTTAGRQPKVSYESLATVDCRRVAERLRALAELLSLPGPSGACCHVHQQHLLPATFSTTQRLTSTDPLRLKGGASCMAMAKPTASSACATLEGGDSQYAWWRRCSACLSVCECWRLRARRLVVGGAFSLLAGRGAGVVRLRVNELTEQTWHIVSFR